MRELLSNNSLFVGQLYEDKSLALRARDLIFFTTDLQTVNYNAGADLFLKFIPKEVAACFQLKQQEANVLLMILNCHMQFKRCIFMSNVHVDFHCTILFRC